LTTYRLTFLRTARKEWSKLGHTVRQQFERKLKQVVEAPHRPAARLTGLPNCYKIKLKDSGHRLVYRVYEDRVVVQVIAVGRRDGDIYDEAAGRLDN
jgi:mRNA interferase RelE/StbE